MSNLKAVVLKLAKANPKFAKALVQELRVARRAETPLEKAVWAAWELFEDDTYKDYVSLVGSVGDEATVGDLGDQDPNVFRLGNAITKALRAIISQSKSWRSAYNLSLEGRIQLDPDRLARDLTNTLISIRKLSQSLVNLKKRVDQTEPYLFSSIQEAQAISVRTERAFEAAIKLAKAS